MATSDEQDRTKMNLESVPPKAFDPANAAPATVVTTQAAADEGRTYNPDGTANPTVEELTAETGTANKNVDDNNRSADFRDDARKRAQFDALTAERDAYKARGDDKRAALVEESLKAMGYRADKGTASKDTTRATNANVEKRG